MSIRIVVAATKNYWMPSDSVYLPLCVGAALGNRTPFIGDDTGDSISQKNKNYCELTGLYWAWKNLEADYIGLCHYRRYFTRHNSYHIPKKREEVLTGEEWEELLSLCPVVVPKKRRYRIESNRSHYNHAHPGIALDETEKIIHQLYPDYDASFQKVMHRTWAHMFNMFVMRRDYFNQYMEWLFSILFALEKELDISGWDSYQSRVFGFVSELLLDVWLEKNNIAYHEQTLSFMEKQNWLKKGGLFLKRKLVGHW